MKKWKKITLAAIGVGCVCAIVPACVISCSSIYGDFNPNNSTSSTPTVDYDAGMEIYQDVINAPIVQSSNGWDMDSALAYFENGADSLISKNGLQTVVKNVLPVNMIINGLDSGSLGFSNQNFTNPYFNITADFTINNLDITVNSSNNITIKVAIAYTITDKNDSGTLTFTNNYEWDNVNIGKTLTKIGDCYYGAFLLTNSKNGLELSPNSSFLNDVTVSNKFTTADFNQLCNNCQWLPRPANIDPTSSVTSQLSQIKNSYQQSLIANANNTNNLVSYSGNNLLLSNWFLNQDQVFCYESIYNFGYLSTNYLSSPIYDETNKSFNWNYDAALSNYTNDLKSNIDYASLINTALQNTFFEYSNNQLIVGNDSTLNSWYLLASNYKNHTITYDLLVKITNYVQGLKNPLTASFEMSIKETNVNMVPTLIPISSDLTSSPAGYGGFSWVNSKDGQVSITYSDFTRSSDWSKYTDLIKFSNILSGLQTDWDGTWNNSSSITNTYSFNQLAENPSTNPANSIYLLSIINTNSNNLYYYNSISNWNADQGKWYYLNAINYI